MKDRISFNAARENVNNMHSLEFRRVVSYLEINLLPLQIKNQQAETMTFDDLQKIRSFLRRPDDEFLKVLQTKGFKSIAENVEETGASRSRGLYIHINDLYPHWKEECFYTSNEEHRVYLIPPWIASAIDRYNNLGHERQMLGVWRSMRTRGTMHYKDYLETDLDKMKKENKKKFDKLIQNGRIAQTVFAASNIIKLSEDDIDMLANLSAAELSLRYEIILKLSLKNPYTVRTREEVFNYMRTIIGKLRFNISSEGEFTSLLRQRLSYFATKGMSI